MIQAAKTNHYKIFNPLVPKAHNSECQNVSVYCLIYKLSQQKSFKVDKNDKYNKYIVLQHSNTKRKI